ncbi:uncharacterized protein MICPUCDRAFT_51268 [Micromonas pusilla CCMP1545]|uniref:Predicted protein n=1 Tax=Micromonas pusilla (strain CCMP1545) TaxID=564608 RepID=C1N155_MICPC|nr:uncharacterized protein MICPUCDRAFT_51268 [Micromonas pusilla CCMP1545]EEH54140.1 predicted protein [Micromonas pusilla CCMP1545]|eukprot:XP_003061510.1 predicted protein [Micromonas pusilla CCMP1545]
MRAATSRSSLARATTSTARRPRVVSVSSPSPTPNLESSLLLSSRARLSSGVPSLHRDRRARATTRDRHRGDIARAVVEEHAGADAVRGESRASSRPSRVQRLARDSPRHHRRRRDASTLADVASSSSSSTTTNSAAVADEFPSTPPAITRESLAPCVELLTVETLSSDATERARRSRLAVPVLVGWFGCEPSHLRKYAHMYLSSELRYDAVVCIAPPAASTLFPALGDAFAATALGAVAAARRRLSIRSTLDLDLDADDDDDETPRERPILLHLFSNGGYLFAGNIMHAHSGVGAFEETESVVGLLNASLRRTLGLSPEPKAAKAFTDAVHALVMDSAPGELEPGMVAASFDAMLQKKAVAATATTDKMRDETPTTSPTLEQTASAFLAWAPVTRRMRAIDAAWGGFPAVTGNRWSGDRKTRAGDAAEVAFAVAANRRASRRFANEDGSLTAGKLARERRENVPGGKGILWCPALFLYSDADPIISSRAVEAFASNRAMRLGRVASAITDGAGAGGGLVEMKKWKSAPHCEIGRADPEGYKRALGGFLRRNGCDGDGRGEEENVGARAVRPTAGVANNIKPWERGE